MASNSFLRQFILDVLSIWGLGTAGGQAAATGTLRSLQNQSFRGEQSTPLSPAEAATAVVKNSPTTVDLANEAALSGVDGSRFAVLVEATGNPPGPETLLTMLNRGLIDQAGFQRGVRQGFLKDEWTDAYIALRYGTLPAAEVIQAAIQNQLSESLARDLWANAGGLPEQFDIALATAGNPPGPETTLTMLNRGIFSTDDAVQALKESRLKDKYIDGYLELARRRIPFRTLNTLVKNKAISVEYALQQLEQLGYTEEDANALIKSATTASATGHHAITEAQVVALYEAQKLSSAEATANLVALGYDATSAAEILQLGDVRALLKLRDQVVTALRSRFVAHRITEEETRASLAAAGVPGDQQDQLLVLWRIEQTANPRELTEAQIRAAVNAKVLTVPQYTSRLTDMGYTADDANILTQTHFPPTPGA